ncbi:MAG: type 1 glutamine amidotransferase domain-containing protein [Pseudomonadota bacterium]|nr:type 1 glutamine amidotransferase domain-containing protein [Pseudomonadota bacterium]
MPDTVLVLVAPEFDDLEVWYPRLRLEEAGYTVRFAGLGEDEYRGRGGLTCTADGTVADFPVYDLAGVVIPGGWAPDRLRRDPEVLEHLRTLDQLGRMIACICHGGWVLISAGLVRGRRLTSTAGIRDDLVNAGAHWTQAPVVIDRNLVTSRLARDLPAFGLAMIEVLAAQTASEESDAPDPSLPDDEST